MPIVDYFQSMYSVPDGYMFEVKWRSKRIQPRNDPYFHIHKNRDNNVVFDSGFWKCWVKSWLAQNRQVQCHRNNKGLTALPLEGTADDLPIPIRGAESSDWQNRNSPRVVCMCTRETEDSEHTETPQLSFPREATT